MPSWIRRFTALVPPPPIPTTLIRAPRGASSWSSYFNASPFASISPMPTLLSQPALLQNLSQQSRGAPLQLALPLQPRRIHGQPGGDRPLRTLQLLGPV